MNTEHLVYILEAYKCGSVNKAARNCYISQSHLSTIIKNVEQEIGYPLFHRTANGITATPEGLIFMSHAEKIVTERNKIHVRERQPLHHLRPLRLCAPVFL